MAIITFKVDDLTTLSGVKDLEDKINRIGMSVESITEGKIEIEVTPNRPDLLDINGMARAIANFAGKKQPKERFYRIENTPFFEIEVTKNVKGIRPFIGAVVAKNLDLKGDKIIYIINFLDKLAETYGRKRKKIAIGINDLKKVRGNLRYDASLDEELIPIGFDKRMTLSETLAKHKKGVQYGEILKGLKKYPILCDSEKVLALIPIINSELSKITDSTKDVVIDVTGTSRHAVDQITDIIACALIDSGADVYSVSVRYPNEIATTPALEYREAKVKLPNIDRTIGNLLTESDLIGLLNKMGYTATKYGDSLLVSIPPYRMDFMNDQDIIEDIAIAHGYENIKPMPVIGSANGVPSDISVISDKLSLLMIGMGFSESYNNYLTNEKTCFENMQRKFEKESIISVSYSKSEMFTLLRDSVLPSLMENLSKSVHEKMPQRLFEIGSTFKILDGKIIESLRLAFVTSHSKANFSEARAYLESILKHLEVTPSLEESKSETYINGRCADLIQGKKIIGTIGEISPKVLTMFKLEEPVSACEIEIIGEMPYFKD